MKFKLNLNKILLLSIFILAIVLRFYNLASNPPSPYWEEAAIGYDAYSILKTGKDFHGNPWPLIAFESFGDYKPAAYFYTVVPAIAVFGLNTFAVRFPSALFGSLTILLIYFLAKQLFPKQKPKYYLLPALFLAISPWHLQLSRAGFEANLGLFLVTLGAWLFLKALKKPAFLFPAVISWALSLYTYHANRVFIPLLGLAWGLIYFKKLNLKKSFLAVLLFILLTLPLVSRLNAPEVRQRFYQTSAFATLDPVKISNQLIADDGGGLIPKIIHHRFFQYSKIFFDHYLDQFTLDFLFVSGDSNPRHSTQLVGSLYLVQLPLLLIGLYYLFKSKSPAILPLLLWLVLAPVPAALTKATPHALRSLALIIPLIFISSYGFIKLFKSKIIVYLVSLVLLLEFSRYLYIYHHDYPRLHSFHWQYGYEDLIKQISEKKDDYDTIYITRDFGRPSIYYWFYTQTNPQTVQKLNNTVLKDQGEYLQFENLYFGQSDPDKSGLVVTTEDGQFKIYEQ
ncbi:ArnT family glycosyltransferase [Patescibacteria group bacterium]